MYVLSFLSLLTLTNNPNPYASTLTFTFTPSHLQEEESFQSMYSDSVAQVIDMEAKMHVDELYERTKALLHKHKAQVEALAEALLKHETLTHNQVRLPVPFLC